jgi:hypothetical protein
MAADSEVVAHIFELFEAEAAAQAINEARNKPRMS